MKDINDMLKINVIFHDRYFLNYKHNKNSYRITDIVEGGLFDDFNDGLFDCGIEM